MSKKLFLGVLTILYGFIALQAFSLQPSVTITSNYIFRGVSQTQGMPTAQTKLIVESSGLYVGAWMSGLNYLSETNDTTVVDER